MSPNTKKPFSRAVHNASAEFRQDPADYLYVKAEGPEGPGLVLHALNSIGKKISVGAIDFMTLTFFGELRYELSMRLMCPDSESLKNAGNAINSGRLYGSKDPDFAGVKDQQLIELAKRPEYAWTVDFGLNGRDRPGLVRSMAEVIQRGSATISRLNAAVRPAEGPLFPPQFNLTGSCVCLDDRAAGRVEAELIALQLRCGVSIWATARRPVAVKVA